MAIPERWIILGAYTGQCRVVEFGRSSEALALLENFAQNCRTLVPAVIECPDVLGFWFFERTHDFQNSVRAKPQTAGFCVCGVSSLSLSRCRRQSAARSQGRRSAGSRIPSGSRDLSNEPARGFA